MLDGFSVNRQGALFSVKALGYLTNGICTQDVGVKTKIFTYTPTDKGSFEFRFIKPDNSFMLHNVTVN